MKKSYFQISPNLIEIRWPKEISDAILLEQLTWRTFLKKNHADRILEIRIGFNTLSILFDKNISITEWADLYNVLQNLELNQTILSQSIWKIPVCYGGEYGYDLENLSREKDISEKDLIQLHQAKTYRLHFYGFLPGFMYLGGLDPKLESPRKSIPDRNIPTGSVAIGGNQTGIYPMESPGGWHVIGRTPLRLFDVEGEEQVIPKQGDLIIFEEIDQADFNRIEQLVQHGQYQWKNA
ncbi:5-oxoprolinase subunit PxpB [Belliella aquatica]|uniref:Allophanate hydrolase n=1 Tax=Belliella aquatica TaxID=1323734 RepID=A0ABQ1MZV9_9BACT|nr:5-oxoprolinase subunit PxpB [Belliella aquatica]MCH7406626.1 5-oxoprolinase subunit PxpB [Belliella aquatica]GGC47958.1 allophanate hydrolase [Belliella aquatica]